jgi:Acyl-CoA thioesterase C-terminal domain/Acyl-CoA thioesterase N-terminal domain
VTSTEPSGPGHPVRPFSAVTSLVPRTGTTFDASVDPEWTIGGKPNGGYLLALLGRAAAMVGGQPHPLGASAHYLRPPEPGPAVVEAETLRAGRTISQVRAALVQDGRRCVEALLTLGRLEPDTEPYWQHELLATGATPADSCDPFLPPAELDVAIMRQVEIRLEPATSRFRDREPTRRGELRGWLALPGDESFDPCSLLFAVDAFPPATFDIEMSGWVPTLELTAYVRALPAPGPVRILQRAQLVEGRRVDEACFVWDRDGRLVAQGTQLAAVRLG